MFSNQHINFIYLFVCLHDLFFPDNLLQKILGKFIVDLPLVLFL